MAKGLSLIVNLKAIDKLTKPLKKIAQGSGHTADALRENREQLKTLERAQKDMRGFRELKRQSQESGRALQAQQDEIRALSRRMNEAGADTQALGRQRQAAIRQARKLSQRYEDEQRRLRDLRASMTRVDGVTGSYADQQRELQRRIRSTNEQIERQQAELREVARRQQAATKATERYHRTIGRANNMRGAGMTGLAVGGGGVFAMSAQALSAEAQGGRLAAQFGESSDQGVAYQDVISQVYGAGRGTDMQQVTEGVAAVGAAFGSLDDIGQDKLTDITRRALTLSDVFGSDVAESVQAAQIMVKNGLAKDADDALDLLGAGFKNVSVQMRDELPEILHEYSTNFRALGFDGQQAMGLLVDAAGQGKFALDKTGDALKEFTIRGSDMSKASVAAYELVGLNAQAMSDAIASGGPAARKALKDTAQAILSIEDPAQRANTAIALFGTPIEDLSVDQIPKFLKGLAGAGAGLGDVTGTIDEMAKTLGDNAMSALKRVQRALSGELMRVLQDVRDEIIAVSDAVLGWMKEHPELVSLIIKATAVIAALVAVCGGLTLVIASLLGPFAATRWALEMVGLRARGADTLLGKFAKGGLKMLGGSLKWLGRIIAVVGRAFLLNPIGLAVTAIAGAAYLIYRNWDSISQFFKDRWRDVKAAFDEGVGGVMRLLLNWNPLGLVYRGITTVLDKMGIEIPENMRTLGGAITTAWDGLSGFFSGLWDTIKSNASGAWDTVGATIKTAWDGVKNHIATQWEGFTALPAKLAGIGGDIVDGLIGGVKGKFTALKDSITGMASSIKGWFADVLGIHSPSRVFAEFGNWTIEGLINGLGDKIKALKDKVIGIASSVAGWFADKLKIRSPSREFVRLGGYTVDGLNAGLDRQRKEPAQRMAEIARQVTRAGAGIALGAAALPVAAMPEIHASHDVALDTRPPMAAQSGGNVHITIGDINVHAAPGMDERALARYVAAEVQRALDNAARDRGVRRRSAFNDID